ncbi:MAG: transporter [Pseudohongiellaceae bacterium]
MRLILLLLPCISLLLISDRSVLAQENSVKKHTVSAGTYYSAGDYGEDTETRIKYFPVSYAYQGDNWGFQLTVPHLEIDGLGNVLVNVGGVTRARSTGEQVSSNGIGDSIARVTYQFDSSSAMGPFFDLVLEAKIPTADETKGLGTGETDYALQLDISRLVGGITLFGTLGYRVRGQSDLFTGLEDSAFVELGFSRPLSQSINAGLIYTYSAPASEFSKDIHDFLPFISWNLSSSWSIMGYGVWGLTEDSPDYAVGAQLSYNW